MSKLTDTVRRHHNKLAAVMAHHVDAITNAKSRAETDAFVSFLRNDLMPHAHGEERHLYPRIDLLMREHGRATATMSVDHEFIETYIEEIERTTAALKAANDEERPGLFKHLGEVAQQLSAILKLHLEKEERVYLPLLEEHLAEKEQERTLDAIHSGE